MQRTVDGEVLHQITLRIKNVHEATLRFVQSGEPHPNVAIYSLNSVRGKIFRDSRAVKGLHQMKCAVEDVNSAVRATIGGIQQRDGGGCNATPGVDQTCVGRKRYGRPIPI